tara:strand:+ start:57 stop:929 length:873 start_codon:yes stop_codon:yes gene_type:complete
MKFIFVGAGYCSEFIIPLLSKNCKIIGIHKSLPPKSRYKYFNYVQRYDYANFLDEKKNILKGVTHILVSIPPNEKGDRVINKIGKDLIELKSLKWVGYFSSTGVYGDHCGRWVDEKSELKTNNTRSKNRIKAEEQYLNFFKKNALPVHIFRLPGIYGPKKSILEKIKEKKALIIKKQGHVFSRVYVKDIAKCIMKSIEKITPGEIYNVSDDRPCSSEELILYVCKKMKLEKPSQVDYSDISISEMTKSFYKENKKVSNKKIKELLDWNPDFRDYKEGLKDIFDIDDNLRI